MKLTTRITHKKKSGEETTPLCDRIILKRMWKELDARQWTGIAYDWTASFGEHRDEISDLMKAIFLGPKNHQMLKETMHSGVRHFVYKYLYPNWNSHVPNNPKNSRFEINY
jgi:hypothetical protein